MKIKFPIIFSIPLLLFVLLVITTIGMTVYERNAIYETRFEQATSEIGRLISLLQKVSEENLAKSKDEDFTASFDVILSHDYLSEFQLIRADGHVIYANKYHQVGTIASQDQMDYLSTVETRDILINEEKSEFKLVYPIRQLAGNFSNHVAYIYSVFNLKPIQRQVNQEIYSIVIKNVSFIFFITFLLFLILYFTVHKPLLSLKYAFSKMSKRNYRVTVKDSIWSEFSSLSHQANETRLTLSLAAKEEALFSQIFNVSEGLYILNDQFNLRRLNKGFSEVFNQDEYELMGRSIELMDLISAEDRDYLSINGSLQNEASIEVDGKQKILLNSLSKVETEGDVFYVGVLKDITRQREEAIRRERARDEFVASVSHELRTPLNGIIGMTKLLGKDPLTDRQKNNVNNILGSSDLLLNVINDILDFSKIEAGKLQLDSIPFRLPTAFSELAAMFEHLAKEKNLTFFFDMPNDVPSVVVGDSIRLQQVINNFCSNAIKFTQEGSVSVSFNVVGEQGGTIDLQCLVKDSGIGIASDKQAQLFQAFKQEDSSTYREHGGTGLGLYISKQLIECMGGSIIFESKKHVGSTFGFVVPLQLSEESELQQSSHIQSEDVDIKSMHILIVDDNAINIEVAKGLLDDHCNHVFVAHSGEEALKVCKTQKMDMVLLDIQMPVMDGLETLSRMKKIEGYQDIPVFALTANVMKQDVEKYRAKGFTQVVAKPFDIDELVLSIHQAKK